MPVDPTSGVVDVILGVAALVTLVGVIRAWRTLWDDEFTFADRRLMTQAAVFLIPPAVVLFHELGHLYTARALGLQVTDFRYGLFEGSVTVRGLRTPAEMWFVALSGNLVSAVIGLGLVVVALAGRRMRRPLRYLLLLGGLLELVFSLVVYPVLSLTTRFGDWIVVYDTDRTPELSLATGVFHALALLALWQWWRRQGKAALFAIGSGLESQLQELRRAVREYSREPQAWLSLADFYARRGELALARSTVEDGIAACGEVPRLLLGLTRLSMFQGRWNDAVLAARRGLQAEAGDEEVRQPLWANLALALTQMERPEHALAAYEHLTDPLADDLRVRYGRGLVRMDSGDVEGGRSDLRAVVSSLPEEHLLRRWAEARLDGHPLTDWEDDPSAPAYARRTAPPPAPIAGV
ncbi:MAG: M50 family metallopeptidase [Actinomycetota bacterium]|nr:M50 family metallopeptidase [Actinomycetota bacterium]